MARLQLREKALLEARDLRKSFDGIAAVDGVNLSVRQGEVVGLVGHNGSGKSTLLDLLCGRLKPDSGLVLVDGNGISAGVFHAGNRSAAVFRSYQVPRLFPSHSVGENLFLGRWGLPGDSSEPCRNLPVPSLPDPSQVARTLSVGQRRGLVLSWLYQRLGIVKFFLLDEPSAGGDESYIRAMRDFICSARTKGSGVLVVEHNLRILSGAVDRVLCMEAGRCREIACDEMPVLTEHAAPTSSNFSTASGLHGRDLCIARDGATVIKGVSMGVTPGEIVGLVGPNGCGKSTLLLALYGDPGCRILGGSVMDGSADLSKSTPLGRIGRRIHLLPQEGGTFKSLTVEETIRASVESSCQDRTDLVSIKDIAWRVPHIRRIWKRQGGALSGGERRLAGLARILVLSPRFALLDEPFAGLDQGSRQAVAGLIKELASQGTGVIMAEQDTFVVSEMCNRVVSMKSPVVSSAV